MVIYFNRHLERRDMIADSIKIESDERGFVLVVSTEEEDPINFRILDPMAFHQEVISTIGPWLMEGASVRRIFECGADEIDESAGAYELNDPKHPRYHSVHVDHYDNRDKLALAKEIGEGWGRVLGGGES
jgi:hypothetical protein